MQKMGDLATLQAFRRHGETIVELTKERERQRANAPILPAKLAEIMAKHHLGKDEAALNVKLRKAAYDRAHPVQKKVPTNEMERIIAEEPKTSAQEVGHHRVPQLPPPPPPPPPANELERMRTVFPRTTAGEAGFHHAFTTSSTHEAKSADQLIGRLSAKQVQADPQMARALSTLRNHVLTAARRSGADGVPEGLHTRHQPKEFKRPGPPTMYK